MASNVECDRYGFFNGIYGLEQSNWANFWKGIIPDGVVAGIGDELQVYAQSDGKQVHVKIGEATIAGHRCWVNTEKDITIADNTTGSSRTDGIVLRVTYGNSGQSKISIVAKTGNTAVTRNIGTTYEMQLATVTVADGFVTVNPTDVTDKRYVYKLATDGTAIVNIASEGEGSARTASVTPQNDRIYRCYSSTPLKKLTVYLPNYPYSTFITEIDFRSIENDANNTFQGVTFYKEGTSTTVGVKLKGDKLTLADRRYNLIIWWDGSYFLCSSMAVA